MIQTENLTYQYKKGTAIFSFPNITLEKRENLLILGASGIGKTTLLHLLAGLLKPAKGNIFIDNTDLNALKSLSNVKFHLAKKDFVSVGENLFIQIKSHVRNIPVPKN